MIQGITVVQVSDVVHGHPVSYLAKLKWEKELTSLNL